MTTRKSVEFGTDPIYGLFDKQYRDLGLQTVVVGGNKAPLLPKWQQAVLDATEVERRRQAYPNANIGLAAGTILSNGRVLGFVDVDDDRLQAFVCKACGPVKTAKVGEKGITIVVQADRNLQSRKLSWPSKKKPAIELILTSGMIVIPPSWHPAGIRYRWEGVPLLEAGLETQPFLTPMQVDLMAAVLGNPLAKAIVDGGADVNAHDLMLRLTSSGIANLSSDLPWLAKCLNALFHPNYAGDARIKTLEQLESAAVKRLGVGFRVRADYDPGEEGPVPLGYTKDGLYASLDRGRQLITLCSSSQLLSSQYLVGLAPGEFWRERYPTRKGFDQTGAGEALIAACRRKGAFLPTRVRGRGIWLEGDRVVVNLGQPVTSSKFLYLCFEPIELAQHATFDAGRLLALLEMFNWRNSQDAMLMLGWLALAPICGVLKWRPHCFVYGPPRSGKTTLHAIASTLLAPLVIAADGQSSEAGIRQTLGPDSLPIMLDEFESDQNGAGLRQILRLARSASSADTPVLKGTLKGKAMTFSLRTAFLFAAVNPRGMSVADQTRIMMLELLMHSNETAQSRLISQEEAHFRSLGSAWCAYMISLAGAIGPAIDKVEPHIEAADRRHRQNISTLLASAFVALHGRAPDEEEAKQLGATFKPTVDRHAEELERDDALECLDHLMAHIEDNHRVGKWVGEEAERVSGKRNSEDSLRVMTNFDMILRLGGEKPGLLIRNGSPAIERVYEGTIWAQRAWQRALHKLPGSFTLENPIQFSGSGIKARCVGIPLSLLPDHSEFRPKKY